MPQGSSAVRPTNGLYLLPLRHKHTGRPALLLRRKLRDPTKYLFQTRTDVFDVSVLRYVVLKRP